MPTEKLYHHQYETEVHLSYGFLSEHDVDLFLMEEMYADPAFLDLFAAKAGILSPYSISAILHSLWDENGESDITVILQREEGRHALLIENKINAPAQLEQYSRYCLRAKSGIKSGHYQSYSIILVAPDRYLASNAEAQKYPVKVSYTEIIGFLSAQNNDRSLFRAGMIKATLAEKESNLYVVKKDEKVTQFWKDLYAFWQQEYPDLEIKEIQGDRGRKARWVEFYTSLKNVGITIKSNRGVVDMFFPEYANRIGSLKDIIGKHLGEQMDLTSTGKSASLRIRISGFNFHGDFASQLTEIREAFDAVRILKKVSICLDYDSLYPRQHTNLQNAPNSEFIEYP